MKNLTLCVIIIIALFGASCTSKRQITYLQDIANTKAETFTADENSLYKLKAQDVLFVKIVTSNPEVNTLFNISEQSVQGGVFNNEADQYLKGFVINNNGDIQLPIIGKINVINKDIEQAQEVIYTKATEFLKEPTVYVKLLSFKYSVMGEVRSAGMYRNFNNKLNVMEAISRAGDITDYGDRKRIVVIRPTEVGSQVFRLDLTDKNILSSPGFNLYPNDVVYVEPLKSKSFKLNIPVASLFLTSISTLILILNLVK
ncbi:MAG: polysaccharide biosynthesis/export family protein [Bacteroidales bacterium]|nr:polysaccharide biosynthesis/export family protein [Bacteroidales bacterium]